MAKLGHRQIAALRAAANGTARTHHSGQGRMSLFAEGINPDDSERVLDRLFELDYITLGEYHISGADVRLTDAGREALRAVDERTA